MSNLPEYQDIKPVVWKKKIIDTKEIDVKAKTFSNNEKFRKLDGDDPDPPKVASFSFSQQLVSARVKSKLDRKTLASKINVHESVIANLENGKIKPERAVIDRLNRVLNVVLKN